MVPSSDGWRVVKRPVGKDAVIVCNKFSFYGKVKSMFLSIQYLHGAETTLRDKDDSSALSARGLK
jgi:hypothetical protein